MFPADVDAADEGDGGGHDAPYAQIDVWWESVNIQVLLCAFRGNGELPTHLGSLQRRTPLSILPEMLKRLIEQLKSPSKDVREAAVAELAKLGRSGMLSIGDAEYLIVEATGEFPKPEYEWQDTASKLLSAARDAVRDKNPERLFPSIERHFANLTKQSKQAALQIVTLASARAAGEVYIRLLNTHGQDLEGDFIPTFDKRAGVEVANALFPSICALARNPSFAGPIFEMLLEFRQAGLVPSDVVKRFHGSLAAVLKAEVQQARKLQRPSGLGWRDEPPYSNHRDMIGLVFDLVGYLDSKSLLAVVLESGDLPDPRLRRFRALTLLRRGEKVSDGELDWIARSPRDRYWLFRQLHELDLAGRLPESCLDQAALAEGNMVDWLCFGTELGREPDQIELFATESRSVSTGPRLISWLKKRSTVDYFFFRFRVNEEHWSKENGWMVGMAGGYARNDQPTTGHDGGTFSTFGSWESKSPAEHVAGYLE